MTLSNGICRALPCVQANAVVRRKISPKFEKGMAEHMTYRGLATLSVRLISIYTFVLAIDAFAVGISALAAPLQLQFQIFSFSARGLTLLVLSAVLYVAAPRLGTAIAPEPSSTSSNPTSDPGVLAATGFAIAGLFLIIPGVAGVAEYLAITPSTPGISVANPGLLWASLVQLLLGVLVFLGSRGLSTIVRMLKAY